MMKILNCLFFVLSFGSSLLFFCSEPVNPDQALKDTLLFRTDSTQYRVQVPENYDKQFLDGLRGYNKDIYLKENVIIAGRDTVFFPHLLKKDQEYTFSAKVLEDQFELITKRINHTTLRFTFRKYKNGRLDFEDKGSAVIDPFFFNGTSAFDDLETGEIYPSTEFCRSSGNRFLCLHQGNLPDENGRLRMVVSHGNIKDGVRQKEMTPIMKTKLP